MTPFIFLFGLTVVCCVACWLAHLRITELEERLERLDNYVFELRPQASLLHFPEQLYDSLIESGKDIPA